MDRRSFIFASAASALTVSAPIDQREASRGITPTRADLERYYAFLWCELAELSREMDVEMLCHGVLHEAGGNKAYLARYGHAAPSTRAGRVLQASAARSAQ